MINIETTSFGYKGNANTISITITDYNLGFPPKILVKFFNKETIENEVTNEVTENFAEMHEQFIPMTQEVYEAWGTDDQVVVDFVLEELGLTEI